MKLYFPLYRFFLCFTFGHSCVFQIIKNTEMVKTVNGLLLKSLQSGTHTPTLTAVSHVVATQSEITSAKSKYT